MKLGGWARVGIVALILWWAYCGFLIYQAQQLSAESGYVDDPYAVAQLSGNTEAAARGETDMPAAVPSEGMLIAQDRTKSALIGAVLIPAIVLLLIAIGRWVSRGFRKPPDDLDNSN